MKIYTIIEQKISPGFRGGHDYRVNLSANSFLTREEAERYKFKLDNGYAHYGRDYSILESDFEINFDLFSNVELLNRYQNLETKYNVLKSKHDWLIMEWQSVKSYIDHEHKEIEDKLNVGDNDDE